MKKLSNAFLALLFLLATMSSYANDGKETVKKSKTAAEMAQKWKTQKQYTLGLLDQMPEEKFEFKPNDSIRTFSQIFKHMATTPLIFKTIFAQQDLTTIFPKLGEIENTPMSKTETRAYLSSKMDEAIELIENLSDEDLKKTYTFSFFPGDPPVKTYKDIISAIGSHFVHHRGQATTYLRINNIKPLPYQQWW